MKIHFLSGYDPDRLWSALKLLVNAFVMILIAVLVGMTDNIFTIVLCFIGIVLFFYALLFPWGKAKYYAIMALVCLILFILLLSVGIGIVVKLEAAGKLHNRQDEAIPMISGFILTAYPFRSSKIG